MCTRVIVCTRVIPVRPKCPIVQVETMLASTMGIELQRVKEKEQAAGDEARKRREALEKQL